MINNNITRVNCSILEFIEQCDSYKKDFLIRIINGSNGIEGSKLSLSQTKAILYETNGNTSYISSSDIYETRNLEKATKFMLSLVVKGECLNHSNLLQINQMINENMEIGYIGGYRLGGMKIKGSDKKFPMPMELDKLMSEYITNFNNLLKQEKISLAEIAKSHIDFISIHPFPDGNGRTGRILINYLLLAHNMVPFVIDTPSRSQYLDIMKNDDQVKLSKIIYEFQMREYAIIMEVSNSQKQLMLKVEKPKFY